MASAFWLLLAGAGIADGKTSILQTKNYIVKKNGTYVFTPDEGYDGFKSVGLDAEIPTLDTSDGTLEPQKMLAGTIGYSQDERMVGTIPTYDGATMNLTSKGDIITIEGKQYRVLNTNGAVAEVLAMYDASTSQKYNSTQEFVTFPSGKKGLKYQGSDLDTYLNETFFATLSATMQAAIVEKVVNQDLWDDSSSTPSNQAYYTFNGGFVKYFYNVGEGTVEVGNRKIYALSITEFFNYLRLNAYGEFTNTDISQLFWNTDATTTNYENIWLRTASPYYLASAYYVTNTYSLNDTYHNTGYAVRPAFQIDLSKIAWSK